MQPAAGRPTRQRSYLLLRNKSSSEEKNSIVEAMLLQSQQGDTAASPTQHHQQQRPGVRKTQSGVINKLNRSIRHSKTKQKELDEESELSIQPDSLRLLKVVDDDDQYQEFLF